MPTISFIGCGKLGSSLGRLLTAKNAANIQAICNQSIESSRRACQFIGAGHAVNTLTDIPKSDMIFIATQDQYIKAACEAFVAENRQQQPGNIAFVHFSGSQTSLALQSAKEKFDAQIGSLHMIRNFANPVEAVNTFPGTLCSFEGDEKLYKTLTNIFSKIGAKKIFQLTATNKALYHASGMFPGNLTVALTSVAIELYQKAGVSMELAEEIARNLLLTTAHTFSITPTQQAFSGPIPRGDAETIRAHLIALQDTSHLEIYKTLSCRLFSLVSEKTPNAKEIKTLLEKHKIQ